MKHTCALALTFGMAAAANAAVVITPTSISYTGTAPELTGNNLDDENQLIDESGLSATPTVANIATTTHANVVFSSPGNAWVTTDPGGPNSDFFASNGGTTVVFDIVLDQAYNITDIATWGYGFGTVNGNDMSEIILEYGVGNYDSSTGPVSIAEAASAGASVITGLGGITADQIRLTITDNHFSSTSDGGDRVGVSELRFIGDVVPEPSSTALLGLGGLALILRRRK